MPVGGELAESFAGGLRRARERRGLSQNALARGADVSPSMVNMLESGERRPTRELVLRLGQQLGLTEPETDDLLAAAGLLPTIYDRVDPTDPDLLLAAGVLGDPAIPEQERLQLRLLIRLICLRWRPGAVRLAALAEGPALGSVEVSAPRAVGDAGL